VTRLPTIGITVSLDPGTRIRPGTEYLYVSRAYARAVHDAGALPLLVPPDADAARAARVCDGFVVTGGALVGQVTKVFPETARVMLISDPSSAVRSADARNRATVGMLEHGSTADSLVLNRVGKDKRVENGDTIITAGSPGGSELLSLFPRGILVGKVTSVNQRDTDIFKHIQVEPFADLGSLQSVQVLVPKKPRPSR